VTCIGWCIDRTWVVPRQCLEGAELNALIMVQSGVILGGTLPTWRNIGLHGGGSGVILGRMAAVVACCWAEWRRPCLEGAEQQCAHHGAAQL
jgi:hypothetical protein